MDQIKVGIIGFGYWGPNLTRNFYDIPVSDLVAVADLREDRLQRAHSLYPNITLVKDYKELFNLNLDAVAFPRRLLHIIPSQKIAWNMDCMCW